MESYLSLVVIILVLVVLFYRRDNHSSITGFFQGYDRSSIKGKIGEGNVASTLSYLSDDGYIILNDLMFKNGTYTTQIDHIVISIHGIFIIETKNHTGWIFGNANKEYWTQNIWGKKYSLYNPILQNKQHIKFILRKFDVLRAKDRYIYPIVVFSGASKLQLYGNCQGVLALDELIFYIHSYSYKVLTLDECQYIANIFQTENITDYSEREVHVNHVRRAIYVRESKINEGICPLCGGKLILRNGRYGYFYGCSDFPRCRHTSEW